MIQRNLPFVLLGLLCVAAPLRAGSADAKGIDFFESKIRPVLAKYCYECHSAQAKRLRAELLLDSKAGMLKGGEAGPALVPGKAKESLIIKALEHDGPTKMPSQSTKLPKEMIDDFVKWIDMGAPDPRDGKIVSQEADIRHRDRAARYWAFQAARRDRGSGGQERRLAAHADRSLHPGEARGERADAERADSGRAVVAAGKFRCDGVAADARRDGRIL